MSTEIPLIHSPIIHRLWVNFFSLSEALKYKELQKLLLT